MTTRKLSEVVVVGARSQVQCLSQLSHNIISLRGFLIVAESPSTNNHSLKSETFLHHNKVSSFEALARTANHEDAQPIVNEQLVAMMRKAIINQPSYARL